MSIATELTNLATNRDAIKAAIEAKNPAVAPGTGLASFPAAIASIPSGSNGRYGDGWDPPEDWPDLDVIADTYPPESPYVNSMAVLFELINSRSVRLSRGTAYRFSDDPDNLVTTASVNHYADHTFSGSDRYVWAIAYGTTPIYGSVGSAFGVMGTTYKPTQGVLWMTGRGQSSSMRAWEAPCLKCLRVAGELSMDTAGGGGQYMQANWILESFGGNSSVSAATTSENARYFFYECRLLRKLDVTGMFARPTTLQGIFSSCNNIRQIDGLDSMDCSQLTSIQGMVEACYKLSSITFSPSQQMTPTYVSRFSYNCLSLEKIVLPEMNLSNCSNCEQMFAFDISLKSLDLTNWTNCGGITTGPANMFTRCLSLSSLIGGKTVAADGSIDGSTAYFGQGFAVNTAVALCPLDHDSIMFLIYWLADLTGKTAQTLTLGSVNRSLLTAEEIAIATGKNWTIA